MTRNTLGDLHNAMMEEVERLLTAESADELKMEIKRANALSQVGGVVVNNAKCILSANRSIDHNSSTSALLGMGGDDD